MTPTECYHKLLAQKLIGEFEKRKMEGNLLLNQGGSFKKSCWRSSPRARSFPAAVRSPCRKIGIRPALHNGDYRFLDPLAVSGGKEKDKIAHEALEADYYLMGANAITQAGEPV